MEVVLVVDLLEPGRTPRRVVSVVDLTEAQGAEIQGLIDERRKRGEIAGVFMAPVVVVAKGYLETVESLREGPMPDPYWEDVAKKAAEDRARGRTGKETWFPPVMAGAQGKCGACNQPMNAEGDCGCRPTGTLQGRRVVRGRRSDEDAE